MGVVLMYSITDKKSFESIPVNPYFVDVTYWIKSLDDNCKESISKVLVGNKVDLEDTRQVGVAEGKALAAKHGMMFFETSAKNGTNVESVFMTIAQDIVQHSPNIAVETAGKALSSANQGKDKAHSTCC